MVILIAQKGARLVVIEVVPVVEGKPDVDEKQRGIVLALGKNARADDGRGAAGDPQKRGRQDLVEMEAAIVSVNRAYRMEPVKQAGHATSRSPARRQEEIFGTAGRGDLHSPRLAPYDRESSAAGVVSSVGESGSSAAVRLITVRKLL